MTVTDAAVVAGVVAFAVVLVVVLVECMAGSIWSLQKVLGSR